MMILGDGLWAGHVNGAMLFAHSAVLSSVPTELGQHNPILFSSVPHFIYSPVLLFLPHYAHITNLFSILFLKNVHII